MTDNTLDSNIRQTRLLAMITILSLHNIYQYSGYHINIHVLTEILMNSHPQYSYQSKTSYYEAT